MNGQLTECNVVLYKFMIDDQLTDGGGLCESVDRYVVMITVTLSQSFFFDQVGYV